MSGAPASPAMTRGHGPDAAGHFGPYGGRYVPETLMEPLRALEEAYAEARLDPAFGQELDRLLRDFVGRPTPLTLAERLSAATGCRVYLKREDLCHTGAHKINNALGQALLAKRMGKSRVVAETGAGQHGVASATVCALLGPRVRRLHGHRGHGPPGAQRAAHASAGGRGPRRRFRRAHPEGRDQRGDARLGHERPPHALPPRLGARRAPLSHDGPGLSGGDRPGGPGPGAGEGRPAPGPARGLGRWAGRTPSACSSRSSTTRRCAWWGSRRAGVRPARRSRRPLPRSRDRRRRAPGNADLPAAGRGRQRAAHAFRLRRPRLSRDRTRARAAPGRGPRRPMPRRPTTRPSRPSIGWPSAKASCPLSSRHTRWPGCSGKHLLSPVDS